VVLGAAARPDAEDLDLGVTAASFELVAGVS
jgi:hypothetical protein